MAAKIQYRDPEKYKNVKSMVRRCIHQSFWWSLLVTVNNDVSGGSDGKASVYNAGDPGSVPGLGRSPGEGNGNPLQYYYLENPMDGGAW